MRLSFSRQSEHDLESIGDYIALDNPLRAASFIGEIRAHCQKIAQTPKIYSLRGNLAPDFRMAPYKDYLIFYRETPEGIRIERILHGARDYPSLF